MSLHDERKKVYALLEECNADLTHFIVGAGKTYEKKRLRFVFDASQRKECLEGTAKYAIKYFSEYNIYLVWTIKQWTELRTVTRGVFTATYNDVIHAIKNHTFVHKGAEFHSRGAERVEVLTYEELKTFISCTINEVH